jgi:hypothetical protein
MPPSLAGSRAGELDHGVRQDVERIEYGGLARELRGDQRELAAGNQCDLALIRELVPALPPPGIT